MEIKGREIHSPASGIQGGIVNQIPRGDYEKILRVLPILCVDIIIKDAKGRYLLVKRANEPKKGEWWVIGGRVLKNETLLEAVFRKAGQEASIEISAPVPVGYYELLNAPDPFGQDSDYHTVSVVFEASLKKDSGVKLDAQSTEFGFFNSLPDDFNVRSFSGSSGYSISRG